MAEAGREASGRGGAGSPAFVHFVQFCRCAQKRPSVFRIAVPGVPFFEGHNKRGAERLLHCSNEICAGTAKFPSSADILYCIAP